MINVIVDTSGSMYEDEKMSAVKYYLYTFLKKLNNYKLLIYNKETDELVEIKEIKDIKNSIKLNFNKVLEYAKNNEHDKNVFITDGLFDYDDFQVNSVPEIYYVAFGKDVNMYTLKIFSKGNLIYSGYNCIKLANILNR